MGKRNERLERLAHGGRELLRTVQIVVGGLRLDPIASSMIVDGMLSALQDAAAEFHTVLEEAQRPQHGLTIPTPRRRGPGRPKRLPAAGENHQGAAAGSSAESGEAKSEPS